MIHIRPARPVDLPGVAAVLQDAFNDKMRAIFCNHPEKVRNLLEAMFVGPVGRGYDGLLVAERSGRIIGTLTIEPMFYTLQEKRAFEALALHELGMPRMLRASLLLWVLGHTPQEHEAYVDNVGVAEDCRGQGVGQLLMEHAEQWALDHQRTRLALWVAGSNATAIHVYEKAGYTISRTRSSWLTRLAMGIRHWHYMEKPLATDLAPSV